MTVLDQYVICGLASFLLMGIAAFLVEALIDGLKKKNA